MKDSSFQNINVDPIADEVLFEIDVETFEASSFSLENVQITTLKDQK